MVKTSVAVVDSVIKRTLLYLRVSTPRQMDTARDINPEGNSIPTQRIACQHKAKDGGMIVVDEYVEPGNSATAIAKRPVFQQMLKRIMTDRDVDCVIVYQMSRVFRNATEALMTKAQLRQIGVELISATEDFGSGYLADAMEGVMAIFNELQVRASGEDIKVKMLNKARNGGTNGRAKLGYVNTTVTIDGHKVNTVAVDEERTKYVTMAFELMATGRYPNAEHISDRLTDAGLRMPKTAKTVSMQTVHKLLRDKYYIGIVTYKGMEYPGHHQPLISEELFNKVQRVMDSHSGAGTRQRTHHHYLKGVIWCARCEQRFMVQRTKNRHDPDGEYYYFFCGGREDKTCDQPYIAVEAVEQAVEDHYATAVWLPPGFRTQVRAAVDAAVLSNYELTDELREQYTKRLATLDQKEGYLLDLAAEEGWPKDVLRAKVAAIRQEREQIRQQLNQAAQQLEAGRAVFLHALELLDNPHAMYQHGNETVRSILNRAFFTRLYVDGRKAQVVEHDLREPFDTLSGAYKLYQEHKAGSHTYHRRVSLQTRNSAGHEDVTGAADDQEELTSSFALYLAGQVSSSDVMVGTTGFEPATPRL